MVQARPVPVPAYSIQIIHIDHDFWFGWDVGSFTHDQLNGWGRMFFIDVFEGKVDWEFDDLDGHFRFKFDDFNGGGVFCVLKGMVEFWI